nr:hypothetical protein Itr_chr15CG16110 [Ipomoea trifida]
MAMSLLFKLQSTARGIRWRRSWISDGRGATKRRNNDGETGFPATSLLLLLLWVAPTPNVLQIGGTSFGLPFGDFALVME